MGFNISEILTTLQVDVKGINPGVSTGSKHWQGSAAILESYSPVDGKLIGKIGSAGKDDYEKVMEKALEAFSTWRVTPAPKRGEIVRQVGDELRKYKSELGALV